MLTGKMKKFFAAMMVTALLCPSLVYADALDESPIDGDFAVLTEDVQQLSEEPSEDISLEEDFDLAPDYQEECDLDMTAFDPDEEILYSADGDTNEDYLTPDGDAVEPRIVGLGTGTISDPNAPTGNRAWTGNYVYFGKYDYKPMKYRVLDKRSTDFGSENGTLLLDCDNLLKQSTFNDDEDNEWFDSKVRYYLNTTFLKSFTGIEQNAITSSTKDKPIITGEKKDGDVVKNFEIEHQDAMDFVGFENDKIFVLDARELRNEFYGYTNDHFGDNDFHHERIKTYGSDTHRTYWTRSTYNGKETGSSDNCEDVGCIAPNGWMTVVKPSVAQYISPAFNVDLRSILFSSLVDGTAGEPGAAYKLTLKDSTIVVSGGTVSRKNNKVTVPYSISGDNAGTVKRLSALVIEGKEGYKSGKAMSDGFKHLVLESDPEPSGTVTFEIPEEYAEGDYRVYLVAENVSNDKYTDYASEPSEINIPHTIELSEDGEGDTEAKPKTEVQGKTVTISAIPDTDWTFKGWTVEAGDVKIADATSQKTTFVMGYSDVKIKAKFVKVTPTSKPTPKPTGKPTPKPTGTPTPKPTATPTPKPTVTPAPTPTPVKKHTITVYCKKHGKVKADKVTAAKGETVRITYTPDKGHPFKSWSVKAGNVKLNHPNKATTSFVMGDSDVRIKALYNKATAKLNTTKLTVKKGKTNKKVKVTLKHDKIKSVKSKNKKIATVKLKGKKLYVTGVKAGKTKITVKTESGLERTLSVTVKDSKITTTSLKLAKKKVTVSKGKYKYITVKATPNVLSTGESITVKSSNKKIATCKYSPSKNQVKITGKKKGTCKVTVKAGKKKKTIKVTVK